MYANAVFSSQLCRETLPQSRDFAASHNFCLSGTPRFTGSVSVSFSVLFRHSRRLFSVASSIAAHIKFPRNFYCHRLRKYNHQVVGSREIYFPALSLLPPLRLSPPGKTCLKPITAIVVAASVMSPHIKIYVIKRSIILCRKHTP